MNYIVTKYYHWPKMHFVVHISEICDIVAQPVPDQCYIVRENKIRPLIPVCVHKPKRATLSQREIPTCFHLIKKRGIWVLITCFSGSLRSDFLPPTFSVVFQGERCEEKQYQSKFVQRGQEAWGQGHGSLHAVRQLRISVSFVCWGKHLPPKNLPLSPARLER